MNCPYCGNQISKNEEFCPYCRNGVNGNSKNDSGTQNSANNENTINYQGGLCANNSAEYASGNRKMVADLGKSHSVRKPPTILVIIVVILGMAVCGVAGMLFYKNILAPDTLYNDFEEKEEAVAEKAEDNKDEEKEPEVEEPEVEELSFVRNSTYDKSYNYGKVTGIHSSEKADGAVANELAEFIVTYDQLWISFVNYENIALYNYLRSGTYAYDVAKSYEQKNISEKLESVDVYDVRKSGDNYYVWAHEELTIYDENENVIAEKTYYWVYKVVKDSNGYYVETFERDPYYKKLGKTD